MVDSQDSRRQGSVPVFKRWEVLLLLVFSLLTAVLFVFKGYGRGDPMLYATGLDRVLSGGIGGIARSFNGEMSFGYYLLCWGLLELVGPSVDMSAVLNMFNALASVVLQLLMYVLFSRLTTKRWVPFFACLMVLLAPIIWLLSHQGHPALLGLAFFIGSLIVLDRIIQEYSNGSVRLSLWASFGLLTLLVLAVRMDIMFSFGAYLGLLIYRKAFSWKLLLRGVAALAVVFALYAALRLAILGYILPPGGGTFAHHIGTRLAPSTLLPSVVKNGTLWVMATNALVFLLGLAGLFWYRSGSRLGILMLAWAAPWCLILPFQGMDFGRIAAPSIPIIALMAAEFVAFKAPGRPVVALTATLVLTQLASVALFYPLQKVYPFHIHVDGRPIADVPVGFLPEDHYYRQRAMTEGMRVAAEVTGDRSTNVGILGHHPGAYRFCLERSKDAQYQGEELYQGLNYRRYSAGQVEFYICDLGENGAVQDPIGKFKEFLQEKNAKLHMVPLSR